MRFRDFFYQKNEALTGTGDIAGFSRIVMPMVRRTWVADLSDSEDEKPKKKHKKKKKDDDE